MMIVFLFSLTYAIIPGKKYYIETYDMPYKRININSGSVRATTPENLEKFSSKNKIKTQLRFVAEKPFKAGKEVFLIEYENKKYIVSKGPEKFGVVTGDDKSEYRFWSIVESVKAPNTYNIKNDKKCLSFLDANTDDKGHFVQIRKCDNKNGQLFRFVDVEEAEKSTSELDGENKENEKVEKASNDEIEKEKALSELEKNKEKDLEKKDAEDEAREEAERANEKDLENKLSEEKEKENRLKEAKKMNEPLVEEGTNKEIEAPQKHEIDPKPFDQIKPSQSNNNFSPENTYNPSAQPLPSSLKAPQEGGIMPMNAMQPPMFGGMGNGIIGMLPIPVAISVDADSAKMPEQVSAKELNQDEN